MQATASPKDFDCTEILGSDSLETRYQPHRQDDGCSVREIDAQCVLSSAVCHAGGPRLGSRCEAPSARRLREIRTQLVLYPVSHPMNLPE
jgi:hypothetical protein